MVMIVSFTHLANLWIMLQLHFEHPHGRFRCGQLLAGAHLVQQMAKANDVDILDFRYGTRPHNGIDARTKAQQAVLKAR